MATLIKIGYENDILQPDFTKQALKDNKPFQTFENLLRNFDDALYIQSLAEFNTNKHNWH